MTSDGLGRDTETTTNSSGGKQSAIPYRCDLLPAWATLLVSKVLGEGASKYGPNNWRKISARDHLNHALTHIFAWLKGDAQDEHLEHAACRLLFAVDCDRNGTDRDEVSRVSVGRCSSDFSSEGTAAPSPVALEQPVVPGGIFLQSGKFVNPANLTADDIDIRDIAHSLSRLERFTGHLCTTYTVAHHSLAMARYLWQNKYPWYVCLQALLHDATEAYIGDLSSPVKALCPEYRKLEASVWSAVAQKFDFSQQCKETDLYPIVHYLDRTICVYEMNQFFPKCVGDSLGLPAQFISRRGGKLSWTTLDINDLIGSDWNDIEFAFLTEFHRLIKRPEHA